MNIISISGRVGSGKDTVATLIQHLICESNGYGVHPYQLQKTDDSDGPKYSLIEYLDHIPESLKEQSGWEIRKFADKLKGMVCLMIGCTREQLEDRDFKNKELGEEWNVYVGINTGLLRTTEWIVYNIGSDEQALDKGWRKRKMTPRLLLQLLGTECGRDILHPNCWINALFADYKDVYIGDWGQGNHMYEKPNWIITDTRFENEYLAIVAQKGITIKVERNTELRYSDLWKQFQESEYDEWDSWLKSVNKFDTVYHPSETGLDHITEWDYVIENNGTVEELIEKVRMILIKINLIEESAE